MPARKQMSLKQMETIAKAKVYDWNERHPNGAFVSYESIIGQGETHRGWARGGAMVQSCEAVIFIEGYSGFVSLEHCTVLDAEVMPVLKVTLVDSGQDFTEWYVRDGVVIDCQPAQGRHWVGTRVLNADSLESGSTVELISPTTGEATLLNHQVERVEVLTGDKASDVEAFGRKWAVIKGIPASLLGL